MDLLDAVLGTDETMEVWEDERKLYGWRAGRRLRIRDCKFEDLGRNVPEDERCHGTRGLSAKTVRNIHGTLHKALDDAVRWGRLTRNAATHADPPKGTSPEMRIWTAEQLRAFLGHVRADRLVAAWHLLTTTGMRRGELLGLRWLDVDLEEGFLAVRQTRVSVDYEVAVGTPKTERGNRTVALDPATVAVLREHRSRQLEERLAWGPAWTDTGLVFTRADGTEIHPSGSPNTSVAWRLHP